MITDIIGDIHGQSEKLTQLLRSLGYRRKRSAWFHPERHACFVGDVIDRGPGQLELLHTVRSMIEEGHASMVLGNHEMNAIGWVLPRPDRSGHWRAHQPKNRHQHHAFLEAVGENTRVHQEWVAWFQTLPVFLDLPDRRVVHACWHQPSIDVLKSLAPQGVLDPDHWHQAFDTTTPLGRAMEIVCKGMEVVLPEGMDYADQQGTRRTTARTAWWDAHATHVHQAALLPKDLRAHLITPLAESCRVIVPSGAPVFFGHYWLTGTPSILPQNTCCVDYSAALSQHPLVSYAHDVGQPLNAQHFTSSPCCAPPAPSQVKLAR